MSSSTKPAIRDWLFKSLTAEDVLDRLEADGLSVRASEDPRAAQRVIPLEDFSPGIRRGAMSALGSYLAFFCFENAIRELISARMLENHGSGWWSSKVSNATRDRVNKRKDAEGENRWHIQRGADEINYTDFGDLKGIIQNNWADFADLFPDQNWVLARLSELEASRNVIAHMNILDERETGRLRLYLTDWVKQVG
jgi:hypothetical protein